MNVRGPQATIDGPGADRALFDLPNGDMTADFEGLAFENFKNVIRCWPPGGGNGQWTGRLTFQNCRFVNGDYVVAVSCTSNMYPVFSNVELENCNLFKGQADSVFVHNVTGTSNTNTAWNGGWCEGGGMEGGVVCGGTASFQVNNVALTPAGVNTNTTADQSWFKLNSNVQGSGRVLLCACRFGGDGGGLPLVKNQGANTAVMIFGVEHHSAWRPRYVFETAPDTFSEDGMSGSATGSVMAASAEATRQGLARNMMAPPALSDARLVVLDDMSRAKGVSAIGTVNYNTLATSHAVFHAESFTDVTGADVDAGFEGLQGRRYAVATSVTPVDFTNKYYTAGPRMNGALNFEALTNRFYNLTFFYRSQGLKQLSFVCANGVETSHAAGLADTGGRLAQGTTSFYVERPGMREVECTAEFCAVGGFLELYPIAITDGPFESPYLSGPQWPGATQEPDPVPDADGYYSQHQTTLQFMGSAAPTNGTWRKGSFVYNNHPTNGAAFGWMCIAGGSPGTWHPLNRVGD
ncbi:MAG: hypothetical protein PHR35_01835 [Kiritimatiellae bacterium]|nr:hypothetical protein [Kiritimatiellia bacterium]